jgi:hypothetical protein
VVATHDIHCDSHKDALTRAPHLPAPSEPIDQAPAVTVMTWRPL